MKAYPTFLIFGPFLRVGLRIKQTLLFIKQVLLDIK